ncbi:hypothetical protein IE985_25730 [Klebsiella pneumoniae]|nr:hypothetical protein [Klebsiella pneumoniae]
MWLGWQDQVRYLDKDIQNQMRN